VNHLSSQRPTLHVELESNINSIASIYTTPIEIITIDRLMCDGSIKKMIGSNDTSCIIGPSIEADNRTSNIGRTIAGIFRAQGYPLSFKTEGAFQPNSTPFLTIHSVKGREFDIVFIFGMDNYPANFPMIPIDEALSLIFVSHSRAKKKIFYIDGSPKGKFTLPLHIESTFVNMDNYEGCMSKAYIDFDKLNSHQMRHFSVCTLVEDHSFLQFLEENRFSVKPDENCYKSDDWFSIKRPTEISASSWGFITGFDFATQLTSYKNVYEFYFGDILKGNYVVLSEDIIVSSLLEGTIINNYRVKDNKRVFGIEIEKNDLSLLEIHYIKPSFAVVLYLYSKYYEETPIDLDVIRSLLDDNELLKICGSPSLVLALKGGDVEVPVTDIDQKVLHGRCDYSDANRNVYEFKSTTSSATEYKSLLQSWIYHVLIGEEESFSYILDLSKGHLYELSSDESIHRWRYIIRSYFILRHHVDLVTSSRNNYLCYGNPKEKEPIIIPDNSYTVDTEFFDKDVFEIALVNLKYPYRTICDLLAPTSLEGMMFALDWLPDTKTEMYKSNINKLKVKFNMSTSKSKEPPTLSYYIASTDVNWCIRKDVKKIDLGSIARKSTENKGCFMAGNFGPKLGELYTILAPFPLEYQPHLQAHTALADSLMLYELIHLGLLKI
jgi:hypothetical protein